MVYTKKNQRFKGCDKRSSTDAEGSGDITKLTI